MSRGLATRVADALAKARDPNDVGAQIVCGVLESLDQEYAPIQPLPYQAQMEAALQMYVDGDYDHLSAG